ncbi:hypothetical protein HL667_06315 [Bradyrhizobium sp. 83012]|uniref:Uncharacterized protein n=1 Tax=Bradyrhizobium aeschynomenes TaxID=2734909 RepID=A0ABX2C8M2_9BRAD|nr:hypothetical protein [Bradyrhizobium aeschynomenes]NPU64606.1 hypothetical protein [Bradyrhizobium aeschynomenes]
MAATATPTKAKANVVEEAPTVKVEEGNATAPTPNTIAEPKTVSTDVFGNKIEEA